MAGARVGAGRARSAVGRTPRRRSARPPVWRSPAGASAPLPSTGTAPAAWRSRRSAALRSRSASSSSLPHHPSPPTLPGGSGPWEATVESVGAVRDGSQVATLRLTEPGRSAAGGDPAPLSGDRAGDGGRRVGRRPASAGRRSIRRLPPPDRRVRNASRSHRSRSDPLESGPANLLERLRRGAGTALDNRDPGARGGPRGRDRRRAARPGRSRPRRRLHHRRRESRRRDLGLEHRDRRGERRRARRRSRSATTGGADRDRDHPVRRVRRGIRRPSSGRRRWRAWSSWPARAAGRDAPRRLSAGRPFSSSSSIRIS